MRHLRKWWRWPVVTALVVGLAVLLDSQRTQAQSAFPRVPNLGMVRFFQFGAPEAPAVVAPVGQPQVAVEEVVTSFAWKYEGQSCLIQQVLDKNDFDIGKDGETYYRVTSVIIDCPLLRGAKFQLTHKGVQYVDTYFSFNRPKFSVPFLLDRVTEEETRWDFTPDHMDVLPGSVSDPVLLTSGGNNGAASSATTAAFTPTANGLLISAFATGGGVLATHSLTNTHTGSGAWTDIEASQLTRSSDQGYSQTGASPGSGTITDSWGSSQSRWAWVIAEVTGHNTSTPASENITNSGTASTLSCTLGSIAAGNKAVGVVEANINGGVTPGTDETEVAEANAGTATNPITVQLEYGTTSTVDWSTVGSSNSCVAIEYAQATSSAQAIVVN